MWWRDNVDDDVMILYDDVIMSCRRDDVIWRYDDVIFWLDDIR